MDLLVLGLLQKILSGSGNTVIDVIIDAILSETSENPVQNKVVTKALKNKADISHKHTAVEVGADSIGSAETALNDAKEYTDGKIADIINGAPSTLDTLSEIATAMDENKSVVDALDKAIGTKANKADIPTKISELENDSNFLTEHQDLSSYAKTEDIPTELPANGGNADTVNNHTVNADVPSDAVFTDTVYTLPIATTEILGGVMPDGTTINVNENGVISVSETFNVTAVDTLLDITFRIHKDSIPSGGKTIILPRNITDYKFLYCTHAYVKSASYDKNTSVDDGLLNKSLIPTETLEWDYWKKETTLGYGTLLYDIEVYNDNAKEPVYVYIKSENEFFFKPAGSGSSTEHRFLMMGIK